MKELQHNILVLQSEVNEYKVLHETALDDLKSLQNKSIQSEDFARISQQNQVLQDECDVLRNELNH